MLRLLFKVGFLLLVIHGIAGCSNAANDASNTDNNKPDVLGVPVLVDPQASNNPLTDTLTVTMAEDGYNVSANQPEPFDLTLFANDPNQEDLTWNISRPPTFGTASVSASNSGNSQAINYVPNADYNGNDSFVVTVTNQHSGTDSVEVNVTITPQNDAPQFSMPAYQEQVNKEGETVAPITISAQDKDGDSLAYSASNLPAGLTMDSNGQISGTINAGTAGQYAVTVTADDQTNAPNHQAQGSFTWTVALQTYSVNASVAGSGGRISPASQTVALGGTTSVTVTPDNGYSIANVSGCNGSLFGNTYTTGVINQNCDVYATFQLRGVEALYPSAGQNWNDYINSAGSACLPESDTLCRNGGELRVVTVVGRNNCTGLSATDTLGMFDWICQADGVSDAQMVSIGLKKGKSLSDLLDFNTPRWLPNSVTVFADGVLYQQSQPASWWSNPVAANNNASTMNTVGAIYLVTAPNTQGNYVINADKIGFVVQPGVTLSGLGTNAAVLSSYAHNFLWIEGAIDATGDNTGLQLSSERFSYVKNLDVSNASNVGVSLSAVSNATLSQVKVSGSGVNGVNLSASSNNTLDNLIVDGNTFGLYLSASSGNIVNNVTATKNDSSGLQLDSSTNNALSNITAVNNTTLGVSLTYSSDHNTLRGITASNNSIGIYVTNSSQNILSGVTAANNSSDGINIAVSSNGNRLSDLNSSNNNNGIMIDSSANNTLSGITTANNYVGVFLSASSHNVLNAITTSNNEVGLYLWNASTYNTIGNIAAANNNAEGIYLFTGSDYNTLSTLTSADNATGVRLNSASNITFTGYFQVGNNTTDCYVYAFDGTVTTATNPGLDDDSVPGDVSTDVVHSGQCVQQGNSDFGAAATGKSLTGSFKGKITTDDAANTSDVNGTANYPADPVTFDWTSFDNVYRTWGPDGPAYPDAGNRHKWTAGSGRIWDWSLTTTDTVALDVLSLPTGNYTLTQTWSGTPATNDNAGCNGVYPGSVWNSTTAACETTFLRNATEIPFDSIGNDNGLCESNEACMYTPNIGSYQGHGATISAGAFSNGLLTGITLLRYDLNGR